MRTSVLVLLAVHALGCSPAAPASRGAPRSAPLETRQVAAAGRSATPSEATAPPPASTTRYRVGDYVVYAYSGTALPAPVTLTEEIIAQDGLRLEIQVTARRGTEERRWIQVVTDTRENRRNDKLDALYVIEDGQRVALANEGNADAYRLYQWIIPPMSGPMRDKAQSQKTIEVAGQSYELTCTMGRQRVAEQEADVEFCDGEAFLWTKASEVMRAVDGGEVLYQMSVQEAGRRPAPAK